MARINASRKARQRRALLMVSSTLSALIMLAAASSWAVTSYVNDSLKRISAGTAGTPSSGPLNILVAGLDERSGLTRQQQLRLHVGANDGEVNTDTLMVVHIPGDRKNAEVVSLPRDSWVSIPGHGKGKINSALALGGPKLMVRTVEQTTGLTIDDYVEVNFIGFIKVIDALGGVNICLPYAVDDPDSGLDISAGPHHVDGLTALEYARDRHSFPASDLARIQDQQQLLATALTEGLSSGTLTNPGKLSRFLSAASSAITVDRGLNVVSLAAQLRGLSASDVAFTTVPLADTNYITPTGQSAVLWNQQAAAALFRGLRNDNPAQPGSHPASPSKPASPLPRRSQISVDVYNGSHVESLSADTGTKLADLGFRVHLAGVDWTSQDITRTQIRYPPGHKADAEAVAQVFPGAALKEVRGLARIQIVLGATGHEVSGAGTTSTAAPAPGSPSAGPTLPNGKSAAQYACR